jgi:hypothetical protein
MNKHQKKLIKLFEKADACTSRKDSKKLILKADKLRAKILAKELLKDKHI